jgi:tetratricopeptide (TPR) repeat protein
MKIARQLLAKSALAAALLAAGASFAQPAPSVCGPLGNGYGPYDYRKEFGEAKRLVEGAHFKPEIEALISGKTADSTAGGDIDYTLRAFPNHHRALVATIRLSEKEKKDPPAGMRYTVECWLERAVRYQPDDTVARLVYVTYLAKTNRVKDAQDQLRIAIGTAGDNPFTHYNIGMLYVDIKDYDAALAQAHKALELGFTRTLLKERLAAVGKWKEPTVAAASSESQKQ